MDTTTTTGQDKKKGLKATLGKTLSNVSESAEKLFQDMSLKAEKMRGVDPEPNWRTLFQLPLSERLLADFPAKVVHGHKVVRGTLFISYHHVCFYSAGTTSQTPVKISIPFSTITELQQAATVPSKTAVPAIVSLSVNPQLKPKVIQAYTADKFVHQFIVKFLLFNRIWVILDHAYRTSPYIMGPVQSFEPPSSVTAQQTTTTVIPPTSYEMKREFAATPTVTTTVTTFPEVPNNNIRVEPMSAI